MSVITVTKATDNGSGSLRAAIAAAKTGDTIKFANSLRGKTISLTSGQLLLDKDLTIDGGSAPGLTVSGNKKSRVFQLERKRTAIIKNLTVANGKTLGPGGGIRTRHESSLTLFNVKLNNNSSELGGAIRVGHLAKADITNSSFSGNDGTLTDKFSGFSAGAISHDESRGQIIIKGSSFINNKGFNGGAIYGRSTVSFIVEDSVFKGNIAQNGGGGGAIFTDGVSSRGYSGPIKDGEIIIRGSRFENNKADGQGGALFLWGYDHDKAIIEDSVIVSNTATLNTNNRARGGGLWAKMALDIRNVTFARNTATQQGGGIWVETKKPVNIVNSTFSANRVLKDAGGAMFLNNKSVPVNITNTTIAYNSAGRANGALWYSGNHKVKLKNSIVAFNTAGSDRRQDQVGFQAIDGGGNIEFALSPKALKVTANSNVVDPRIGALKTIDGALIHPLLSNSPAVNSGTQNGAPATDQRGRNRDRQVDVGAFELLTSGGTSNPPIPSLPPATSLLIKGTAKNDVLNGRDRNETFKGRAGDDRIKGRGGNDSIYGNNGDDSLFGDAGNDRLIGGNGVDILKGGIGNDNLQGGNHSDKLYGGSGNDILIGGGYSKRQRQEKDLLVGGRGADVFVLGTRKKIFYNDGRVDPLSKESYALIEDFNLGEQDVIRLRGKASNYRLGKVSSGKLRGDGIFRKTSGGNELIAVVQGSNALSLPDAEGFEFI